jgi:hypothetical protein
MPLRPYLEFGNSEPSRQLQFTVLDIATSTALNRVPFDWTGKRTKNIVLWHVEPLRVVFAVGPRVMCPKRMA